MSRPEITPGAFWVIVARPRTSAPTVASVVASPSPTSSASARSIRSSIASQYSQSDQNPHGEVVESVKVSTFV